MSFRIEVRAVPVVVFGVSLTAVGGVHCYLVLVDDGGEAISALHGVPIDRRTGHRVEGAAVLRPGHVLRADVLSGVANAKFDAAHVAAGVLFDGDQGEARARFAAGEAFSRHSENLGRRYAALTANANAMALVLARVMGLAGVETTRHRRPGGEGQNLVESTSALHYRALRFESRGKGAAIPPRDVIAEAIGSGAGSTCYGENILTPYIYQPGH